MSTPRFAEFHNLPEVDSLYGRDPAYTRRCEQVGLSLYEILKGDVRIWLKMPFDLVSHPVRELCHHIADVVEHTQDEYEYGIHSAFKQNAVDLLKLSRCFVRYGLASEPARRALNELYRYVRNGDCTGFPGVAA